MGGVVLALLTAMCWAAGSVSMKELSRRLDPFTLNAPRALIAGAALFITSLVTGRAAGFQALTLESVFYMVGSMAIGGVLGDSLYILSMRQIGLSRAYPIAGAYPAITLVFSMLFLGEWASLPLVAGLALVVGGILLISRPQKGSDLSLTPPERRTGVTLALLAGILWAVAVVLLAPGLQGNDPILVASVRVPALALMFWGVVAARRSYHQLRGLGWREWATIAVGSLLGWGLGSVLFVIALAELGATRTAILTSTSPLFALPLCVVLLKESVNRAVLVGTVLTVTGVALVS